MKAGTRKHSRRRAYRQPPRELVWGFMAALAAGFWLAVWIGQQIASATFNR